MADEGIVAVIVDDHPAIVAGVERWCADADPPIRLIDAGHDPARARAGPGRDAQVVILDLHSATR